MTTKSRSNICGTVCMALMYSLVVSTPAGAHSAVAGGQDSNLSALVDGSQLIALTTVEEVQYRTATFSDGNGMMPVSFVTVRIDKVFRGQQTTQTLTLRFMGGPDGMGGVMGISGVPTLQKGDRDILFITGNGETRCALVHCEWGRYRILKDRVYNTHGFPVLSLAKNYALARGIPPIEFRVVRFPSPKFDDLFKNPFLKGELPQMIQSRGLTIEQARAQYEKAAPKFIELKKEYDARDFALEVPIPPETAPPQQGPALKKLPTLKAPVRLQRPAFNGPIHINEFIGLIGKLSRTSTSVVRVIASIDPAMPLVFKPIPRSGPPKITRTNRPALEESDADRAWREAEERDPFNPGQKPLGAK